MTLILKNQTENTLTYLSGTVTVPGNSDYTVTTAQLYPLCRDAQLVNDCSDYIVWLSDSVTIYQSSLAVAYLNQVALSLGGAVVGFAGANAPSFEITIGGKDSNGKSQPARMNQFADLATNFRNSFLNLTGNATTTVKSGSGTLHGILINNNATNGVIKIYDNTAASGTVISTIQCGSPSGGVLSTSGIPPSIFLGPLGLEFSTGLTVVTTGSGNNNVTVIYQ